MLSWDPVWETIFSKNSWGHYPGEELIRFVAKNYYAADDRSKVSILELGCGPGANLWFCAREGFKVFGVDASPTAIKKAKDRLDAEVPGWQGELSVSSIENLNFESNTFDAFIDNEAVCCNGFDESTKIYKEAARVLKSGGKFYIRTFAVGSYGFGTGENVGPNAYICSQGPLAGKGYARFTNKEDLEELLGPALKVNSCEMLSVTCNNELDSVKEYIIQGVKL